MTDPEPLRILSLGGGTQSCALALMSARGDLTVNALGHPLAPMPQAQRDALNVVTWSELT